MSLIRVVIFEDHVLVREGLEIFFEEQPDMILVNAAPHGSQVLDLCIKQQPDVILIGLSRLDSDMVNLINRLLEELSGLPIVIMATSLDVFKGPMPLQAERVNILSKNISGDALVNVIRSSILSSRNVFAI